MHRLVTILDTEAGPSFISQNELQNECGTRMSTVPQPNIYGANKNALLLLGITKLRAHLHHRRVALKFSICKKLTASAIIVADLGDQHAKSIRPNQRLVKLNSGDCIPSIRKPKGRMKLQAPIPDNAHTQAPSMIITSGPSCRENHSSRALTNMGLYTVSLAWHSRSASIRTTLKENIGLSDQ